MTTLAVSVTRAWLHLYTSGLDPEVTRCRREEIESDLWEMQHDATQRSSLRIVQRLLGGRAGTFFARRD